MSHGGHLRRAGGSSIVDAVGDGQIVVGDPPGKPAELFVPARREASPPGD